MATFSLQQGRAYGSLRFGASPVDAEKIFGAPEEIEDVEGIAELPTLVWHYWNQGFSLFFDRESGERFSCVEFEVREETTLFDVPVFGMKEAELKQLFRQQGFKELDEENQDWGEKRISFDDAHTDCYFERGKLVSINSGVHLQVETVPLILPN